ncbi:MAG: 4Fe-4S dicluster domain-containing protein [Ruminococcaceae bacterium]|nr:4Fe-4S dicluster domain-containing protein [Oscillospiraceae bacterium]
MKKFDTKVQHLKYKVLREVARHEWNDTLEENIIDLPKSIIPGNIPTMRCCVYKERAILSERIKLAMGGDKTNPNVIEVINIACDECPVGGYEVTDVCRGCLAHRCEDVCPKDAFTFDENHVARIDKSKCINCGLCATACPFNAIINRIRPCQNACKINAISVDDDFSAKIDNDSCTACGACVYQCPFGAISDKSYILDLVRLLKKSSEQGSNIKVYAVVAPTVSSQFTYAKLGQVVTGLKKLGFCNVTEAALGADMVAQAESKELAEKGFITSSCCPAFVAYIEKNFPDLKQYISHNLSPMATVSKYIKDHDENAKVVFIGPCTAKKAEIKKEEVSKYVDIAITFEELQALFDSRDIDITSLEEGTLDNASYFGRIFARCGGLSEAVAQGLKEQGFDDFELKPISCDGIEACRTALLKKSKNLLDANFIEGMACVGGCIGGAGCLTHSPKNKSHIESHSKQSIEKTISSAIEKYSN